MATVLYLLCAVASAGCTVLMFWIFWQHRGVKPLVLWTGLCFAGFAVSNSLVVIDMVVVQNRALVVARAATACAASGLLLFGLIWDGS